LATFIDDTDGGRHLTLPRLESKGYAKAMGVNATLCEGRELRETSMRFETAPRTIVAPDPSSISITDKTADFGDGAVALHDML
jgi:hypothetical protein